MKGAVEFRADGKMVLDAVARDDCPTPNVRGIYRYSIKGNRITTTYTKGYGFAPFFLIKGISLYLSRRPIARQITEGFGERRRANWIYRLVRLE